MDFATGSLRKYRRKSQRSALHMLNLARAQRNGQVQLPRGCSINDSSTPSSSLHQWQSQVARQQRAAEAVVVEAKALLRMPYSRPYATVEAPPHQRFLKKWSRLQGLEWTLQRGRCVERRKCHACL